MIDHCYHGSCTVDSHYCLQQLNHHLRPLFKIPEGSSVLKTSGAPSFKSQGHPRISLYSFSQALKIEKLKLETEIIQKSRPSWDLSLSARLQFFASSQKDNNVYSGKSGSNDLCSSLLKLKSSNWKLKEFKVKVPSRGRQSSLPRLE